MSPALCGLEQTLDLQYGTSAPTRSPASESIPTNLSTDRKTQPHAAKSRTWSSSSASTLTKTTSFRTSGEIGRDGEIDLAFPRTIVIHAEHGKVFRLDAVLVARVRDGQTTTCRVRWIQLDARIGFKADSKEDAPLTLVGFSDPFASVVCIGPISWHANWSS